MWIQKIKHQVHPKNEIYFLVLQEFEKKSIQNDQLIDLDLIFELKMPVPHLQNIEQIQFYETKKVDKY